MMCLAIEYLRLIDLVDVVTEITHVILCHQPIPWFKLFCILSVQGIHAVSAQPHDPQMIGHAMPDADSPLSRSGLSLQPLGTCTGSDSGDKQGPLGRHFLVLTWFGTFSVHAALPNLARSAWYKERFLFCGVYLCLHVGACVTLFPNTFLATFNLLPLTRSLCQ